ncbi:E3 SUMO-protein ligase-like protein [Hapsidospora chrysogenum ATCC 11550]|uniref:E3 SUMO-protein ligase-like protein n=1 Tax=Hapsidospora chrysogenum (strain ATCC 11550 / CBS 779.69 / DSM 880 / IAM 14645 / JCM 23072 / IMI 49137) TaxID=857340 RepID=A0A086SZA5_HAPC1|nr:E3 SUMO-protein ligase-like protein [Hapsidospora chrysogenum ATCC 11550]
MATTFPSSAAGAAPASLPAPSRRDVEELVRQIRSPTFYNRQLSSICQVNGLKSTGVKADLQRRITDLIQLAFSSGNVAQFHQIRQSIDNAAGAMTKRASPAKPPPSRSAPHVNQPVTPAYNGGSTSNGYPQSFGGHSRGPAHRGGLQFHPSPFYTIEAPITDVLSCPVMTQHRNSIHVAIRMNEHPAMQRCVEDTSYRVMVFCAADTSSVQHIAFPHQSELKVNGGDLKANLRGLKNKPGSTRPVDITSQLRLKPSTYTNNIEFTYALTTKKFYLTIYLCKIKSVSDLVSVVSTRQRIPKASVIAEINKKAMDPDVVAVSQVLSLKCPLSYMRLEVPCRGTQCSHIQSFDATSYLQLQEQGPQWVCPICNKPVPFEQLAVDEYVKDILQRTPKSLEVVTIEPNGQWSIKSAEQENGRSANANPSAEGDDEIEIQEVTVVGGRRQDTPKNPTSGQTIGTPVSTNRSSAPRGAGSTSSKRPAPAVIDLTLSSDDEDDEPRPAKRQNRNTNGLRESTGDGLGFFSPTPPQHPP